MKRSKALEGLSGVGKLQNALKYIYEKGVLHWNLRPANYLVVDLDLRLCDFGGSKNLLDPCTLLFLHRPQ